MKDNEELYVYGRILGLFRQLGDISPATINSYFQMPHIYLAQLHKHYFMQLIKNEEITNRLMILMNHIGEDKFDSKIVPTNRQSEITIGMYHEMSFHNKTIGERLKEGRKAAKLTQQELADRTGLVGGKNAISRYESDRVKPNKGSYIALSEQLGYKYL